MVILKYLNKSACGLFELLDSMCSNFLLMFYKIQELSNVWLLF